MTAPSSKQFSWYGWDAQGQPCQGDARGYDSHEVADKLTAQGIVVQRIRRRYKWHYHPQKLAAKQQVVLFRQMTVMLKAGLPLLQILQILQQQSPSPTQACLQALHDGVATGSQLSQAMAQQPHNFKPLHCALVASGEQVGRLDEVLHMLTHASEQRLRLWRQLRQQLSYPLLLLVTTLVVYIILLWYVVPAFSALYQQAGTPLPPLTLSLLTTAHWLHRHLWHVCGLIMLLVALVLWCYRHTRYGRHILQQWLLHLPVFGPLWHQLISTRILTTLALTLQAGLPLLSAVESALHITTHITYQRYLLGLKAAIEQGRPLAQAFHDFPCFSPLQQQLMLTGANIGRLDTMTQEAAHQAQRQLDNALQQLTRWLEPILMGLLATLIGIVVIAMYLPIFDLGQVLR